VPATSAGLSDSVHSFSHVVPDLNPVPSDGFRRWIDISNSIDLIRSMIITSAGFIRFIGSVSGSFLIRLEGVQMGSIPKRGTIESRAGGD
jgi:hypothetical protein